MQIHYGLLHNSSGCDIQQRFFLRSNNNISPDVGHIRLEGDLSSALADTRPRLELPLTRLHDLQKDG